jgi:uncharacterized protein
LGFTILHPSDSVSTARHGRCALAIMAKVPGAGRVKTRLSPPLSPEQAAKLSACFLRDTAENIAAVAATAGASAIVSYTPIGEESSFEGVLPAGFELIAQRGDDFGDRLWHTAEDLFACGFSSVCLIDSDSPTVPAEAYQQAVRELAREGDRVVIGAASDGGYYLIGLKQLHPELFEGVRWSTDAVYRDTLDRAGALGLEVIELPLWYDVDDAVALDTVRAELLAGMAPGFAVLPGYKAPHTKKLLMDLDPAVNAGKVLAVDAGGAADAAVDYRERPPAGMDEGS